MKVILAMAISLNGMVARENGEEDWLPSEGWTEFLEVAKQSNNIVMGRETYDLVTQLYPDYNFDNVESDYKIVITRDKGFSIKKPYIVVHSPQEAMQKVNEASLEQLLLIGGGKVNSAFLRDGLVDEIWLTVNPFILGKGRPFIAPEELEVQLALREIEQLNKGRVLFKYKVEKG